MDTKLTNSTNFGLLAVFVKVALEITKRAPHLCFKIINNKTSINEGNA